MDDKVLRAEANLLTQEQAHMQFEPRRGQPANCNRAVPGGGHTL